MIAAVSVRKVRVVRASTSGRIRDNHSPVSISSMCSNLSAQTRISSALIPGSTPRSWAVFAAPKAEASHKVSGNLSPATSRRCLMPLLTSYSVSRTIACVSASAKSRPVWTSPSFSDMQYQSMSTCRHVWLSILASASLRSSAAASMRAAGGVSNPMAQATRAFS